MDNSSNSNMKCGARFLSFRIQPLTALLSLILSILIELAGANQIESAIFHNHLSWKHNETRYDFVFDTKTTLPNIITLESDSNNYLTESLASCQNHSACLFQDGKLLNYFQLKQQPVNSHKTVFSSEKQTSITTNRQQRDNCDETELTISHYCSTHWNPPAHLNRNKCSHAIEWHSPLKCPVNSTNYERPCYIYDPRGNLIDLTPWIKSDSSSYQVNTSIVNANRSQHSNQIKGFYINVCNEAHDKCGPNVSACFIDPEQGDSLIEAGYNNLTSLRYAVKENNTITLTSQGQIKEQCENSRIKTVIRFVCKKPSVGLKSNIIVGPKLIRSSGCENVIEWETIHACPLGETKSHVLPDCKLKYEPLGIEIDVGQITKNASLLEVPNIGPSNAKMLLGICKAVPKSRKCEGKEISSTSACLIDASGNSSQIIATIHKSTLRLADDRLYFESTTMNKTCSTPATNDRFNVTRQLGVRVEFFCSPKEQSLPTYLGFEDCSYIFEWGSPLMCFEALASKNQLQPHGSKANINGLVPDLANIETLSPKPPTSQDKLQQAQKSAIEQHKETLNDATKINEAVVHQDEQSLNETHPSIKSSTTSKGTLATRPIQSTTQTATTKTQATTIEKQLTNGPEPPRMNAAHKFFMISLIIMSLVAFLVIILVLDKKTQLRIPLGSIRRQAGQQFQAQPVPYSRVVNDLDL